MSEEIDKKDLFEVIKHGAWHSKGIKEELERLFEEKLTNVNNFHDLRWDSEDEYYYLHDNDCYLFVYHGKIIVRSDRQNVFSTDTTLDFPITQKEDVENAYNKFLSMTMEVEDE